jgi:hypothetical protein
VSVPQEHRTECPCGDDTELAAGETVHESCVAGRWRRTRLSLHLGRRDYRAQPPKTAHAVCPPGDTLCTLHHDEHHPVEAPLEHIRRDALPALGRRVVGLLGRR